MVDEIDHSLSRMAQHPLLRALAVEEQIPIADLDDTNPSVHTVLLRGGDRRLGHAVLIRDAGWSSALRDRSRMRFRQ